MYLTPGNWMAAEFAERELRGEHLSIEFLRAALESAPTNPAITSAEGRDMVAAYMGA